MMFLLLGPAPFFPFIPYELWLIITTLLIFGITVGVAFVTYFKAMINGVKICHPGFQMEYIFFFVRQLGYEESLDTFGMFCVLVIYKCTNKLGFSEPPNLPSK
ncbi:hypothetical protein LOTGIDRAFT_158466 [Lottia gigantea]|uniref:Uncharacterized protein n=1 Tax=Lottia gigantea TaxID=225164 RepID=V4CBZ9_LOTGI|nr:hypothetical protein LOTGIDRAFT_158466 [Lottia gigantea]ESO99379.1 hypothetical protein LOTGIDRAFT_158466 [Lottia gigantea]